MDSLPNRSGCSVSLVTRFAKNWFEILHSNRIVAFSSLIRLWSFRRFLFAVKFWSADCRKETADLAYFGQSKIPLVSLFADPTPGSFDFIIMNPPNTFESHNRALFLNCRDNVALGFISENFTVELRTRLAHFFWSSRLSEQGYRLLGGLYHYSATKHQGN